MALLRARIRREPLLPRQFSSSRLPTPPPPPKPAAADPPPSQLADIRDLLSSKTSATASAPFSSRLPRPPSEPASADRAARSAFFADFRDRLGSSASASASSPRNDDLRHKLRHFPMPPPPTPTTPTSSAPSSPGPSFIDVFAATPHAPNRHSPSATPLDYATLRDSLSNSRPAAGGLPFPGARKFDLKTSLLQRQGRVGSEAAFGRDQGLKSGAGSIVVQREYSYDELGKRLGDLRPAGAGKDGKEWFSLEELSARVGRLREMEEEERERATLPGKSTEKLRAMLLEHSVQTQDQKKTGGVLSVAALMGFGGQTVQGKPQEELMERYFHPEHMSSAEKMKLELKRVRDKFKMSENDCGSARVQVAQLTTKIKHLSATLHKKDKHSRKGLQEMVQRRKKYLKYLRRTDWDSYCLVLKSLGLRDVPEYKAPDYKSKSNTKSKTKKKSKRKRKA